MTRDDASKPATAAGSDATGPSPKRTWRSIWLVAVLVLLSLPILFYRLDGYSLVNGDEGFYHYVARHMVETGDWFHLEFTGQHRVYDTFMNAPIHYWARAGLIAAFGDNFWTMRLLSAACGLLTVLMTYRLATHLANRWAGFVAGLLQLATVQFVYLHGARTGEMEAIIAFLYALSAYLFLRSIETGRSFVPHHVCLVLLANMKLPFVIVPLMADLAFILVTRAARRRLRGWALVGLVVLPFGLIWHISNAIALGDQFWQTMQTMASQAAGQSGQTGQPAIGVAGNALFYARVMLFGAFPLVLAYPLAIIGSLPARTDQRQRAGHRLLLLYPAAVLAFFIIVSQHYSWYITPAYPFLSVLLAIWLERLRRTQPSLPIILATAVILAMTLWIRVEIGSFNPFATQAALLDEQVSWWQPAGISPIVGVPTTALVLAVALYAALRLWRATTARSLAYMLTLTMLAYAGVRTLYPLRYTDHQSPTAKLRQDLDAARNDGRAIRYPVPVREPGLLKARFHFADDFRITPAPPGSRAFYFLYPRPVKVTPP